MALTGLLAVEFRGLESGLRVYVPNQMDASIETVALVSIGFSEHEALGIAPLP